VRTHDDALYFGERWLPAATGERITVNCPHPAGAIGSAPGATERDVDQALALAGHAFDGSPWPHLPPSERAAAVTRILDADQERTADDSPFGPAGSAPDLWYKQSGIGREYGPVGPDAYLEDKSIDGAPPPEAPAP
jgi:acyl-CoA reductase-like NAD-dependent aldehyde dehydrogenase